MAVIGESGALEQSLRRLAGDYQDELEGRKLPNGSPSALMICAAAMGCISMIRKMAELNKVSSDKAWHRPRGPHHGHHPIVCTSCEASHDNLSSVTCAAHAEWCHQQPVSMACRVCSPSHMSSV